MGTTHQIVCGGCGQINRFPADRDHRQARCGKCRNPLFGASPAEVDAEGFARHLANTDIPVLVDVWAPWCGPCRTMAPMFERAARELEPRVRSIKLNSDEAPGLSGQLGIRGIPTLLLMHRGREIARSAGAMDARRIVDWTLAGLGRPSSNPSSQE